MTREQILVMEVGGELDALVAEKVMGWERDMTGRLGAPAGSREYKIQIYSWAGAWDSRGNPSFIPNYSTDISAVWEVVEKMQDYSFYLEKHGVFTWASFTKDRLTSHECKSRSAPEAICKAALLATLK